MKNTALYLTIASVLLLLGCAHTDYPVETGRLDLKVGESQTILEAGGFLPGAYTPGAASLDPDIVSINSWDHHGDFETRFNATAKSGGRTRIVFLNQVFAYPETPGGLHPDVREAALERLRRQTGDLPENASYAERRRALLLEAAASRQPIEVRVTPEPTSPQAQAPINPGSAATTAATESETTGPQPSASIGRGLFYASGSNSCVFCHGLGKRKGMAGGAANLERPKSWKAYQALGGRQAYRADPDAFVAKLRAASIHLIENGAIRHKHSYEAPGFDWSKIDGYSPMMMGLGGTASKHWLERYASRGITPGFAAASVWEFLTEVDKQGILKP